MSEKELKEEILGKYVGSLYPKENAWTIERLINECFEQGNAEVERLKDELLSYRRPIGSSVTNVREDAVKKRNAEVKGIIKELDWSSIDFEEEIGLDGCGTGHFHPNKKQILQKLGLDEE